MGYGGIDFNPQPQQGPISALQQGLTSGVDLGFGLQRAQLAQQESVQRQQALDRQKKQDEFDQGYKALALISDKNYSNKLSDDSYEKVLKSAVPFLNNTLNLGLSPDDINIQHHDRADLQRISDLIVKSADPVTGKLNNPDILKNEINVQRIKAARSGDTSAVEILNKLGDDIKGAGQGDGLTTYQNATLDRQGKIDAGKLRIEFLNRPEVKDFVTINTQVKSMDAFLNKALQSNDMKNKVALDQALISMFNKLTDPSSVVRESEYARTPENLPIINRFVGAITKLDAGGAGLTNEDRKALVFGAKVIANERGQVFNDRKNEYASLANDLGLDPSIVTRTVASFKPYDVGATSGPKAGDVEDGYRFKGGDKSNPANWEKL